MSSIEFVNCIFSKNNKRNDDLSYFLLTIVILILYIMISCARKVENFHKNYKLVKLNGRDYIIRRNKFSYT